MNISFSADSDTMLTLEKALESFNRKERNLLVRDMLSNGDIPRLGADFCKKVSVELGFEIPEYAWWATDYHIDWLAGAVASFVKGAISKSIEKNPETKDKRKLVEGNQEDFDLIIATENKLIFIEAKAYGAWGNDQLENKLVHLGLLYDFYKDLVGVRLLPLHEIEFHFLIISPNKPTEKLKQNWPNWACNSDDIPWIKLNLGKGPRFLVTRCDDDGNRDKAGQSWCVVEQKSVSTAHVD